MSRELIFYKSYFKDFYQSQSAKVQEKIDYCLYILQEMEVVPEKFVKYITNSDGIYELRVSVGTNEYRILFFFEEGDLVSKGKVVILANGFIKKDTRDYKKAVEKAASIKSEYFDEKRK